LQTPRETSQFKDDKYSSKDEGIKFSHSSYSEALPYLLVEDGYISRINRDIFSELLFKLSEKDEAAGAVALAVAENFDKLPEDVRTNLLFKLAEKDEAAWVLELAVADFFDKLPEDVRNLLFNLAEKDKAAGVVAFAVANNFDKFPEAVRNKLLFKLAEKDKAAGVVAFAVANNFDKLPEAVRNLLDRLQEPLQQVIEAYSKDEERRYKEQALHLISNALPKLNLDFVLKILKELCDCEDETVRIKAAKMLKDIFGDLEGKKEY
jgi:AAA+ superfamily predicted ATPase